MAGTGEYYAEWNKPGSEKQIPYDLPYKWNLITKQTREQNRMKDMEIKNWQWPEGREEGYKGEKGGRVKSKNKYKGPMDKDKRQQDWMWEVGVW